MHTIYSYVEIKLLASSNSLECTQYTFILGWGYFTQKNK